MDATPRRGQKCLPEVALVLALFVVLSMTASPVAARAAESAYVANHVSAVDAAVSQYAIAAGGFLSPLSPATVTGGLGPYAVAVSPNGRSAYVTNTNDGTISQYDIDPFTGALSPKTPPSVAAGTVPEGVAVGPDGRSLYATSEGAVSGVLQYDIDPLTGALSPKTPAAVAAGVAPLDVAVSPDGTSAYVTNQFDDGVSQFDIDPVTGGLSPKTPSTVATASGAGAASVTVNPDGRSAYVTSLTVSQYDIDPQTGALSLKTPASVGAGENPRDIAVTPDGRNAYTANLGSGTAPNTASQYTVDPDTGTLSPKTPPTVATGAGPTGVAVSADGASAYITNQLDNSVSQYDVDEATGALSPKTPASVPTGGDPIGIAVTPVARIPTSKEQCKRGGWRNFPQFKNQGQCVAFVVHHD